MPKASEYLAIEFWGRLMGSYRYYIEAVQEQAAKEGAPLDSVYYGGEVAEQWTTLRDCTNDTQAEYAVFLAQRAAGTLPVLHP